MITSVIEWFVNKQRELIKQYQDNSMSDEEFYEQMRYLKHTAMTIEQSQKEQMFKKGQLDHIQKEARQFGEETEDKFQGD